MSTTTTSTTSTITTTATVLPQTIQLQLSSAYGPVFRTVSTAEPRDCSDAEIPIIDVSGIYGDLEARKSLAREIKHASEEIGFFYIRNHGVEEATIKSAHSALMKFFKQPMEKKMLLHKNLTKFHNGYSPPASTIISVSETVDIKEHFSWKYDPRYDPEEKDLSAIPENVRSALCCEELVWDRTSHLPGFKEASLEYWAACLTLARKLVRIFALALDLPEDYFDSKVTYPGADGVYNYYPPSNAEQLANNSVGIGSHTDLQCFTLLWQDQIGGLQVLNKSGEWIKAKPVPDTFVVNIGDFLMRLTNDQFKSTVHRVYNRSGAERVSMPFFFGFNFNEKCEVLPSCTSENNPPKYAPISCGEWCQMRFNQGALNLKKLQKSRVL